MTTTVRQAQGKVQVTVLGLEGDLDASNYLDVIARARELCAAGAQHVLIDMSDVPYMASSGLMALHSIALLARGEEPPDPEHGWAAFHAIGRDVDSGPQQHVKLLNPQPRVERVLKMAGFDRFFEVFRDEEKAVASF
jgi:anti-anti-sigma regulatory factor